MRNEEKNSRKQEGLLLITIGLLLIAAALSLVSYNLYDELRAEQSARQAVTQLDAYLPAEAAPEAPSDSAGDQEPLVSDERTVIPDYVLSPNMEMPVETINGIDFIGVLRIPALELELPIKYSFCGKASVAMLHAEARAYNTFDDPDRVRAFETEEDWNGNLQVVSLPACSVCRICCYVS